MTLPDALEQVLWDDPPMTTNLGRWATGDVQLAGKHIREGDMLLLGLAAGNADPAIRPDAGSSVRGNRSHLAFSGGPHECPGQDLGRAIADTGIDILISRLPDLRLSVPVSELSWNASLMSRPLAALPVEFTPGRPRTAKGNPVTGQPVRAVLPPHQGVPATPAYATTPAAPAAPLARRLSLFRRLRGRR